MKKHENIGQWRATLYPGQNDYLIKITAVIPTDQPGTRLSLEPIDTFSSPDYGLVFRLENADEINVESEQDTYLSSRHPFPGICNYKKIIIIGFRNGEKTSFLIALIDIRQSPDELH